MYPSTFWAERTPYRRLRSKSGGMVAWNRNGSCPISSVIKVAFKARVQKNRLEPELRPRSRWGSITKTLHRPYLHRRSLLPNVE